MRREEERLTIAAFQQGPSTPPSESADEAAPEFVSKLSNGSDDDEVEEDAPRPRVEPKKGGYDSRIEQMLHEHPELDIQIVQAGKNTEGGGGYITYTIRTGVS